MKTKGLNPQSGASVTEVLIVLVTAGLLLAVAVSQFGKSSSKFQRHNITHELKVAFERARFDSVKRRASVKSDMSKVVINSSSKFTVYVDMNQDGVLDTSTENRVVDFAGYTDARFAGYMVYPVTVEFDQFGHAYATDGSDPPVTINPKFLICDSGCTKHSYSGEYIIEGADASNSDSISISQSGTVAVIGGGESLPSLTDPNLNTNANTTANVRGQTSNVNITNLFVYNSASGTSPTAVTPTPTPTATPVNATPTPTPEPTVAPTPTPTVPPSTCSASAPVTATFSKNGGSGIITISYSNASSTVFTITKTGSINSVSPTTKTSTQSSGSFNITVNYPNGNVGSPNTVVVSGCGTTRTTSVVIQ